MRLSVSIQKNAFNWAKEEAILRACNQAVGSMVAFQGVVRAHDAAIQLKKLSIEHYPVFTEQEIAKIAHQANQHWPLIACRIIHRVGALAPGEPIVLVLVATKHRQDAFQAAQFLMNHIKTEAPLWKREELIDGSCHWVKPQALGETA